MQDIVLGRPFAKKEHCNGVELLKELFDSFKPEPGQCSVLWCICTSDAGRADMVGIPAYAISLSNPGCFAQSSLAPESLRAYSAIESVFNCVSSSGINSVLLGIVSGEIPDITNKTVDQAQNKALLSVILQIAEAKEVSVTNFYTGPDSKHWCDYAKMGYIDTDTVHLL